MLFILFIGEFLFVASHAACSSHTTIGQCNGDNDCSWMAGKCKPFNDADCSVSNCRAGCIYTAPVAGTCQNQLTQTCADRDGGSCEDNSCDLTEGTCVPNSPPSCPTVLLEYWEDCPSGCKESPVPFCEFPFLDFDFENLDSDCDFSVTPITECAYHESCEWSSISNKCVSRESGRDDYCEGFSNSPKSVCEVHTDHVCNVSSESCVFDSSYYSTLCAGYDTIQLIYSSQCEHLGSGRCVIEGDRCVTRPGTGYYPDGNSSSVDPCNELEVVPISECEVSPCVKQGNTCIFSASVFDSYCDFGYGVEHCVESNGYCKVSNNKCVFARDDYCGRESTDPLTECDRNMHRSECKVSNNQCVSLTPDEKCSAYSVIRSRSECEENSFCHPQGGVCVLDSGPSESIENCAPITNRDECHNLNLNCTWIDGQTDESGVCKSIFSQFPVLCRSLSTSLTISECDFRSYGKCAVNSDGACVSHVYTPPVCELNQGKSACNNPISGCVYRMRKSCEAVTCGNYSDSASCEYQGCTWSSTQSCVPDTNRHCSLNSDGSCESPSTDCVSGPATTENCVVDLDVSTFARCNKATTSACNEVVGCKWNMTDGGTCVEKTCSDNPTYARCCPSQDTNCAYCSGLLNKPSDCFVVITNSSCSDNPSYSNCCPGDGCTGFCVSHPEDVGCKSSGSHIFAPCVALLLLLMILL